MSTYGGTYPAPGSAAARLHCFALRPSVVLLCVFHLRSTSKLSVLRRVPVPWSSTFAGDVFHLARYHIEKNQFFWFWFLMKAVLVVLLSVCLIYVRFEFFTNSMLNQ